MNHSSPPSRRVLSLLAAVPIVVAACSSSGDDGTSAATVAPTEAPATSAAPATPSPDAEAAADAPSAGTAVAAAEPWLDIELTDAATGESFTLASLAGAVVAIEPMAVWCPSCRNQQNNVKKVYDDIEASGATFISLGIDPGESADMLATYADRQGFPWTFVQSPIELSRALSDRFGPQILSAPSTPLIVLDPSGSVQFQDFGHHGPDALLEILAEADAA